MQPLDRTLRNRLEQTIKEAREVADEAARAAVEQLGIGEPSAPKHLTPAEVDLRRRLRIHGHQLGDQRDSKSTNPAIGRQEISCLIEEVAYEHWHRMLFARFLAENNLLMYPDPDDPVPVSLEECKDLAVDEGAKNGWELAARFAKDMLPEIFRADSPVFRLVLPPEHHQRLERLLVELPSEVFHASDSLGWVYQFWQAKRKDEVNASEVKIGARELPAVTQLFTEPYMVSFLLHNTLGAWWAGKHLTTKGMEDVETEAELRKKFSLPEVDWEYLRFVRGQDGKDGAWRPAAGTFDAWPKTAAGLRILDPCCGSGHFLVAALHHFVPIRIAEEGLSAGQAVDAVLRDNLHGLEIDERCCQIAAFALAFAAWTYPNAGGYRLLPDLHIACTGIGPQSTEEEWLRLAGQSRTGIPTVGREEIKNGLLNLHRLFSQAPTLGSLINPGELRADLIAADYETIQPYLAEIHKVEKTDDETRERAIAAAGMVKAADLLAGDYTLVVTNVPYLGRGKQDDLLKDYLEKHYKDGKADLATAFVLRCLECCAQNGATALVTPQIWLFLEGYRILREKLLDSQTWRSVVRLGSGAFETIGGAVVNAALLILQRSEPDVDSKISALDVSMIEGAAAKGAAIPSCGIALVSQRDQRQNPDARVTLSDHVISSLLGEFVRSTEGLSTGDGDRFIREFCELDAIAGDWEFFQTAPSANDKVAGFSEVVYWQGGRGVLSSFSGARIQGHAAWGRPGVLVGRMNTIRAGYYAGHLYDKSCVVLTPKRERHLLPVSAFCRSPDFEVEIRRLDKKLGVATSVPLKVPFDLGRWEEAAVKQYPNGLPEPESDDPTQWLFHGRPEESAAPLHVAVARLLAYRWPAELDDKMRLSKRARAIVERCDELAKYADNDGIVCIPAVRGELSAADRLCDLLAKAFGSSWSTDKLNALLKQADHGGKTLETWLRDKFFVQHCQLFHHRPFIWHIWDGLRDGFSVLVNYHKLDYKNLETLIYTYLGDWIKQQRNDITSVDGAQERLAAAENLKRQLELILKGAAPCDIFVRWKPIEKEPIGWNPDLNDGVRLNIRPFVSVADVGRRGAGVLRDKPNIDWKKDRGKDVESAPWYHLFEGDRINDHHLTLEEKQAARAAKKEDK